MASTLESGIDATILAGRLKHGHRQGKASPEYCSWRAMKVRCYNTNREDYEDYGGRGIKVCDRWKDSFANFLADMGPRPQGTTIDRRDVNGDYEPDNCWWATYEHQNINKRKAA
jgi:hypothetical protein